MSNEGSSNRSSSFSLSSGVDDIPLSDRSTTFTTSSPTTDPLPNFSSYKTTSFKSSSPPSSPTILTTYLTLTLVGLSIGTTAALLNVLTEYFSGIRTGYCQINVFLNESYCPENQWHQYSLSITGYLIFIIFSVLLSSTACWSVLYFAPLAAGSGISEIKCIVSGFTYPEFLEWKVFLLKALCLPLAIGSGLSVGKEGPSVHYAVCCGSCIALLLSSTIGTKYRNVLVSSSAAGVAVAFGSPMGGVLFAIEEISHSFNLNQMWESYYCSLVAVATLQFWNPFNNGKLVMFEVRYDKDWNNWEIPLFILCGVFGALYGTCVAKYNVKAVNFRKAYLSNFPRLEVLVLTLVTAIITYWNEFLSLDMTQSMQLLFQECPTDPSSSSSSSSSLCQIDSPVTITVTLLSLLLSTVIRMLLTTFTYGSKVPAGIFVPSMACGATFGRFLGILIQLFISKDVNPGIYAFLGAAAALSGITHLTVSVVVIMFELTGALKYIIPTMIALAVTKMVIDLLGNKEGGIADVMIGVNGLPFLSPHGHFDFQEKEVGEAMVNKELVYLPYLKNVSTDLINKILQETEYSSFPVLEPTTFTIKGLISREALLSLDLSQSTIDLTTITDHTPLTLPPSTPLSLTLLHFLKLSPCLALIRSEEDKLLGLLTRKDFLKFEHIINKHIYDSRKNEQRWGKEESYALFLKMIGDRAVGYLRRLLRREDYSTGVYGRL